MSILSQPFPENPSSTHVYITYHLQINWLHIIQACKQEDHRAQETLYRMCYPDMLKVCQRYVGGDLDQAGSLYNQAMLKVFRNIGQFKQEGEFLGWIRRIVVNVCIDHCRSETRFRTVEQTPSTEYLVPVVPEIYSKLSGADILKLVHTLPKNTGLVFNLFVMEGYKHEEIGQLLKISTGTSKWHLNEARRLLKLKLEQLHKKETLANAI